MRGKLFFAAGLLAVGFWGCGYRLAGKSVSLPGGGDELSVPLMQNRTMEAGVEDLVTLELRQQIFSDSRVRESGSAPVELRGVVTQVSRRPLSFSEQGRINAERVQVSAEFRLVRRDNGRVVWESGELSADEEYPVSEDPLVTERAREQALKAAAADLAELAIELLLGDF